MSSLSDLIVWVDCEMTGLDINVDQICEIAVVVTDSELNELDPGLQIVVKPSDEALANMGEFVTKMHTDSGLIKEIPKGVSIAEAENKVLDYIKQWSLPSEPLPWRATALAQTECF